MSAVNVFYLASEFVSQDCLDKLKGMVRNLFVDTIDPEFHVDSVERYKLLVGLPLVNWPVMINWGNSFGIGPPYIPSLVR
jgi:hypothetical protein